MLVRQTPLAVLIVIATLVPLWVFEWTPSDAALSPPEPKATRVTDSIRLAKLIEKAPLEKPRKVILLPEAVAQPEPVIRNLKVKSGDTLMAMLTKAGIPRTEAHLAIQALSQHYNPKRMRPGQELTVIFQSDLDDDKQIFSRLIVQPDHTSEVSVDRQPDNRFKADKRIRAIERRLFRASGEISSSLYIDAIKAGVPASMLMELIRIYSWDVDFQRGIRRGDRFEMMYERLFTSEGKFARFGNILYAKLVLSGENHPLYRHTTKKGLDDYFDDKGQSARKALMRTPINGARLSSGYGRRRHPILGYTKMHRGVDFAAPRGTPIYAAGNGTVSYRARKGAYGRYIRIRHNSEYSTAYAHLKSFTRRVRRGTRVKQGQVIGYVGTTGRSTGPHLHYEIIRGGRQVNPRRIKMPSGKKLKGEELERFAIARKNVDAVFASLPEPAKVAVKKR